MSEQKRDESPVRNTDPHEEFWKKYDKKPGDIFVVMYHDYDDQHIEGEMYFTNESDANALKTALEKHDPKYYGDCLDVYQLKQLDPADIQMFILAHRPNPYK